MIEGQIQTNSYTNQEGQKIYTTNVIAREVEFGESKNPNSGNNTEKPTSDNAIGDGFMNIPDSVDDESLPFN